MRGRHFARGFKHPKWPMIIIVALFAIFLCVITYWWIIDPIASSFFVAEKSIYQGLEYYLEGDYLEFEDGSTFQAMLSNFSALNQGEPIAFWYFDNYIGDNPIYGKSCDIYALDIIYQEEEYINIKRYYEESDIESKPIGNYTLFASVESLATRAFVKGIAFCDEKHVIRCVLVTDLDTLFLISNVFDRNSNLDWGYKGQGDGSLVSSETDPIDPN